MLYSASFPSPERRRDESLSAPGVRRSGRSGRAELPTRSPARAGLVRLRPYRSIIRDLLMRKGVYNPKLKLPIVPLSDGAGEVVATGSGATRFKPGDGWSPASCPSWVDGP